MNKPVVLPATLSAGRVSRCGPGTREDRDFIRIEIIDDASRITVAHIEIGMAEMMAALTNLANQPCTVEWRGLNKIGWRHEHKTETVPYKHAHGKDAAMAAAKAEALKPFEADGWTGYAGDLGNHHKASKDCVGYNVSFVRWVEP